MTAISHVFSGILAQDSGGSSGGASGLVSLAPILLIFVAMYFLMIRPQQKRARAQKDLLESLEVGDEVLTVGGMFGTIVDEDDESLTVEVSPGTRIRMVRNAIARKLVYDEDEGDYEYEDEVEDDEGATEEK
jgi:preprotein translocase subunit YajC